MPRTDRPINDYFAHGTLELTLAGVLAKSSNIGTVLAAASSSRGAAPPLPAPRFGLGQRDRHRRPRRVRRASCRAGSCWTARPATRIAFGQGLSVNAVQMAAAVNTIANGGVSPARAWSQGSATTDDGATVGTDTATTRRVISAEAAQQTSMMMEMVTDPEDGTAPRRRGPGLPGRRQDRHRAAGRRGRAAATTARSRSPSPGFAPADDPRFTVYVVVQNPTQRRRRRHGRRPGVHARS